MRSATLTLIIGFVATMASAQSAKITPSDPTIQDRFGVGVALSGDVAVIGADHNDGDGLGVAYVFRYDGSQWVEEAKLEPSDGSAGDGFGFSVGVSGDVAVVGASQNDGARGSVYVYRFDGAQWAEEQKLLASDGVGGDELGFTVAVAGDVILSGALGHDHLGEHSGSAYVFRFNGSQWIEEAELLASDGEADDWFGTSVGASGDFAVVGAHRDDNPNGSIAGSAYVFRFDGSQWLETKLIPSDGRSSDNVRSVAIAGDLAVLGAWRHDDNGADSGSAFVFRFDSDSQTWAEEVELLASDGGDDDEFGVSVAVAENIVIVGAHQHDDNGGESGSAYVFRFDASTSQWIEEEELLAGDGASGDNFGFSVATSGGRALVGAWGDNDNGENSGSAYVLEPVDSDSDGLPDDQEIICGTDPFDADSDDDGLLDGTEFDLAGECGGCPDPLVYDSDGDTLSDGDEVLVLGTDPCNPDLPIALGVCIDALQAIIDANTGTPLADKLEEALASLETALEELNKEPPDNQAAVGNMEGAVGSICDAVLDEGLDPVQGVALMDKKAGIARRLAADAIDEAIAVGGDAGEIQEAMEFMVSADSLRELATAEMCELFKIAISAYKEAVAKAEGALP